MARITRLYRFATWLGFLAMQSFLPLVAAAASLSPLRGVDQYIEKVRADLGNVGLSVAVVRGKEVLYQRGFGLRQLGTSSRIGPDTLFQIGSTTKAITAAALGILVDEGKIRWDDPIVDYVPAFRLQDPWLTRHLTIRDALAHRSGVGDSWYYAMSVMDPDSAIRLLSEISIEAPYRDSFVYNNLMYAVLGKVVESASGLPWPEFVKHRLLGPLRMTRSGTSPYDFWDRMRVAPAYLGSAPAGSVTAADANVDDVALPHGRDENGSIVPLSWVAYDNAAAAGAVISSAKDMANWLILNLNEGAFDDRQILKKETVQELHALQNPHGFASSLPLQGTTTYAMGWQRSSYHGRVHLSHVGGIIGFPAYVALMPDQRMGVVVLSNGPGLDFSAHLAIAFRILDRLLGLPDQDLGKTFLKSMQEGRQNSQKAEQDLRAKRATGAAPSLPLDKLSGTYKSEGSLATRVMVTFNDGHLRLVFSGEGAYSAELEHWQHDLFRIHSKPGISELFGPQFATFSVDPLGQVESMTWPMVGTLRRVDGLDAQ